VNILPFDPVVLQDIAEWNDAHEDHGMYNTDSMHSSHNGYNKDEWPPERLEACLRAAADLIRDEGENWIALADVYCFLDNAQRLMTGPHAWCVIKNYNSPGWRPAVWCGWTDKKLAEQCAVALAKHYGPGRETWTVEWARCPVTSLKRPGVEVQAYVDRLGR
jgi:hypothetical protein